jgi:hypothetical protein
MKPHLCECGCGKPTKIARKTASDRGHIKGQPHRYLWKHHPVGSKNPCWTGAYVGYHGGHQRVNKFRGKPHICEDCGMNDPRRKYHWANLSGKWHDLFDYRRLCVSCHRKFDNKRRKAA